METVSISASLRSAVEEYGLPQPRRIEPGSSTILVSLDQIPVGDYILTLKTINESSLVNGYVTMPVTIVEGTQSVQVTIEPVTEIGIDAKWATLSNLPPFVSARSLSDIYPSGSTGPGFVESADFNGDGRPDLVMGVQDKVAVLLTEAPGLFGNPSFLTGTESSSSAFLSTGDFNGDGKADIVSVSENVSIFLGQGNGTFSAGQTVPSSAFVTAIRSADLDGDGKDELVAFKRGLVQNPPTASLLVFPGTQSGLGAPTEYEIVSDFTGFTGGAVEVGDFDGDGQIDVTVVLGRQVLPFSNIGGILAQQGAVTLPVTFLSETPVAGSGDFDGDGFVDLAVVYPNTFGAQVLFGSPGGVGNLSSLSLNLALVGTLCVDDFDGDGKADLVASSIFPESGTVLTLSAGRTFLPTRHYYGGNFYSLASADFDGDGRVDLVGQTQGSIVTLLTGSSDIFEMPRWLAVQAGQSSLLGIASGDVNEDGRDDYAVVTDFNAGVRVHPSLGGGRFAMGESFGSPPANDRKSAVRLADMDSDGHLDLISGAMIRLGKGDGTFDEQGFGMPSADSGCVVLDDFNGDGLLDVAGAGNGKVTVSLGQGDGSVVDRDSRSPGGTIGALVGGDFDGDGNRDLAWTAADGAVVMALGNGDGTIAGSVTVLSINRLNLRALGSGDFNQDGRDDLIVTKYSDSIESDVAMVLNNDGVGGFQPSLEVPVGPGSGAVLVEDFNGDNRLDIVVASFSSADITVLLGNGSGGFTRLESLAAGLQPETLTGGDFDGDGKRDLLLGAFGGQVVLWAR